jgi:protoheme IX farnesyltransferase
VGWVSAGGELLSIQALIMAMFFFIWQVPHFYLLAIKYGHDYEAAGFPSITSRETLREIRKRVFRWVCGTALAALVVSVSHLPASRISAVFIILAATGLILSFLPILRDSDALFNPGRYFMRINYFVLIVILMLVLGPLLYRLLHF